MGGGRVGVAVCVGKYTIRRQLKLTWSVGAAMRARTCGEKTVKEGGGRRRRRRRKRRLNQNEGGSKQHLGGWGHTVPVKQHSQ